MVEKTITKRLCVKASNGYDGEYTTVPVNTLTPIEIESDIGKFSILVLIRNFDGSEPHHLNSLYNIGDKTTLNNNSIEDVQGSKDHEGAKLSIDINYTPKDSINGKELLFGNDFDTNLKNVIPTKLLSVGLKLFNWFINNTVNGNLFIDRPFLYGPILTAATYLSINNQHPTKNTANDSSSNCLPEKLNHDNIPKTSFDRKKHFNKLSRCEEFTFQGQTTYNFKIDTNFIILSDSKYMVSLPTFRNHNFNIDLSQFANDKFNNLNWVIKVGGSEGVDQGDVGLVINFRLLDEHD